MPNISFINSYLRNLNSKVIIFIFFGLGLMIYGNALFNSFVVDDFGQISNNPSIQSILNIPSQFFQDTFYDGPVSQQGHVNFYRPMLSSTFSLIYMFSGNSAFGFHLVQIILHIINGLLVYYIFKYFFKPLPSLLLALLFLVHPINVEAVVYISTLEDTLFLLFGLLALVISMKNENTLLKKSLVVLFLILSLFSKETGGLFLLILPIFTYLYLKRNIFITLIQSFSAFIIYAIFRFIFAQIYFGKDIIVPIQTLPFIERVINIPKIIFFYFYTFLFPVNLSGFQTWVVKSLNFQDFYLPLTIDLVVLSFIYIFSLIIFKTKRAMLKEWVFFLSWFVLGLGLQLQLIPLDQTVADHWFYFTIIGLFGMIGTVYTILKPSTRVNFMLTLIVLTIIVLFSIQVIIRNSYWKNQWTLFNQDIKYNPNSNQLEDGLGEEYAIQGKFNESEYHYIRATRLFSSANTFYQLGYFYLVRKKFKECTAAFQSSINHEPENFSSWDYLAVCEYKLGNKDAALTDAQKAYAIFPNQSVLNIIQVIQNNAPINIQ